MTTLHKQAQRKLLKDGFGEPVRAERWRNVFFTRWEKSYRAKTIFTSRDECDHDAKRIEYELSDWSMGIRTADGYLDGRDYSHTIQMPIGGQS